jgi:hypothetical protein
MGHCAPSMYQVAEGFGQTRFVFLVCPPFIASFVLALCCSTLFPLGVVIYLLLCYLFCALLAAISLPDQCRDPSQGCHDSHTHIFQSWRRNFGPKTAPFSIGFVVCYPKTVYFQTCFSQPFVLCQRQSPLNETSLQSPRIPERSGGRSCPVFAMPHKRAKRGAL